QRDWGTDPDSVRRRVQKRVDAKRGFFIHLVIYMIVMMVLVYTQPQAQSALETLLGDPTSEVYAGFVQPAPDAASPPLQGDLPFEIPDPAAETSAAVSPRTSPPPGFLAPLAALNWAVIVALMWGSGVIAHAIDVFYETGRRYERRRRAFLGELEAYYGPDWH